MGAKLLHFPGAVHGGHRGSFADFCDQRVFILSLHLYGVISVSLWLMFSSFFDFSCLSDFPFCFLRGRYCLFQGQLFSMETGRFFLKLAHCRLCFIHSWTGYSVTESPKTNLDLLHTERHNNNETLTRRQRVSHSHRRLYKERMNYHDSSFRRRSVPEEVATRHGGATRRRERAADGTKMRRSRTASRAWRPFSRYARMGSWLWFSSRCDVRLSITANYILMFSEHESVSNRHATRESSALQQNWFQGIIVSKMHSYLDSFFVWTNVSEMSCVTWIKHFVIATHEPSTFIIKA